MTMPPFPVKFASAQILLLFFWLFWIVEILKFCEGNLKVVMAGGIHKFIFVI